MSYKLLTPGQKAVNRDRTIMHYAWLTGIYHQYCHVSVHTKQNGRYTWQYPEEREQFLSFIVPEVEKFCGKYFTDATNPDNIPHPIRVAMYWHNGILCKDAFIEYAINSNKEYLIPMLPMIHERMVKLKIAVNVPPSEWTI